MNRGKKIILLAHCLLNVNAKVGGLAGYTGMHQDLVSSIIHKGYGLIQLPCPELGYFGIQRWGQIVEQMDIPAYRRHCRDLLRPIVDQIEDYSRNGYEIVAVIGVDKSPSCGVDQTCSSDQYNGEISCITDISELKNSLHFPEKKGIFIEEFQLLLLGIEVSIPFYGIDEESNSIPASIQSLLS